MKRTQNHLCVVAPQKPQPKSNHEWASVKSKLKVILQNCWPVIFKHAKVLKDEGSLGPSSRLKETKEMWPNSTGDFNLDPRALQNITRTSGIQPGTLCSAEYHQDQRHSTWTLGLCRISPGPAASNLEPCALENITRTSSNPWMESEGQMTVMILPLLFSWFGRGGLYHAYGGVWLYL